MSGACANASNNAARATPRLRNMMLTDVDRILPIEQTAYSFPWTRGNFIDSLAAGHIAWMLEDDQSLLGYLFAMHGAQETHLLNLTVAPDHQRRGLGLHLLQTVVENARQRRDQMLWLEVRDSNQAARRLYEGYGLQAVGRRRGYYPAGLGRREDAIVMSLDLAPGAGGPDGVD